MRKRFKHFDNEVLLLPERKEGKEKETAKKKEEQEPPSPPPTTQEAKKVEAIESFKIISLKGKRRKVMEFILLNIIKETESTLIARMDTSKAKEALGMNNINLATYIKRLKQADFFLDIEATKDGMRIITLDKKAYLGASPRLSIV